MHGSSSVKSAILFSDLGVERRMMAASIMKNLTYRPVLNQPMKLKL